MIKLKQVLKYELQEDFSMLKENQKQYLGNNNILEFLHYFS
jgi:hypothetical protein